jgi:hypothetical protein
MYNVVEIFMLTIVHDMYSIAVKKNIPDDELPVLPRVGHGDCCPHVVGCGVQ